ncbi:MAG: NAD-dependent deacylase [Deltaproteobacteria bacterium]|nr:NAD-dependent deacylase [Deltaproteobacteria bacterium]
MNTGTKQSMNRAAKTLVAAGQTVALTGAGISVESGIPPFRGKGGVWEKFDPMEYAYIDSFLKNPEKVWRVLLSELFKTLKAAQPNKAHKGLAALESMGKLQSIITQNVDGLHQQAGSGDVLEFHGTFARYYCMDCGQQAGLGDLDLTCMPPRCRCDGVIRPDCVFFGEPIPPDLLLRSEQLAAQCDVMLVVGTSASVTPASDLPVQAKAAGATIIEVNAQETPLTNWISDIFLKGKATEMIHRLATETTDLM